MPDSILGPCPCTGCRHAARCGSQLLACEAFSAFVGGFTLPQWTRAPRTPTVARYEALFGSRDPGERAREEAARALERVRRMQAEKAKKLRAAAHPAQRTAAAHSL